MKRPKREGSLARQSVQRTCRVKTTQRGKKKNPLWVYCVAGQGWGWGVGWGFFFRASNVWEHKVNRLIISRVTAQVKIFVTMAGHSGRRAPHARLSGQTERSSEVFQPGQGRQERRRAGSFVRGQMASCLLEEKKKKKRSSGEEWRQKLVRTQSGPFLPLLFFFLPPEAWLFYSCKAFVGAQLSASLP